VRRRHFVKVGLRGLAAGALSCLPWNTRLRVQGATVSSWRAAGGEKTQIGAAQSGIGEPLYEYDGLKWLYIGWENDHPKSWTFMGGGLAPGQQPVIQYTVTIGDQTYCPDELTPDRKANIKWYLREGYLPCPVSQWEAATIKVEIRHFANRIFDESLTAVTPACA